MPNASPLNSADTLSIHHLEEITSGRGEGVTLSIRWNKARLVVDFGRSAAKNTTQDRLIERYNAACLAEDYDEEEKISEQILDATENDKVDVVPTNVDCQPRGGVYDTGPTLGRSPATCQDVFRLSIPKETDLPKVAAKDICVLQSLLGDGYITHVSVEGREMCFKVGIDYREDLTTRGIVTFLKIRSSQQADIIRVPKLLGLIVRDSDDERIIGFLQEHVPSPDPRDGLSTLGDIEPPCSVDETRRRRWAMQVQETVRLLHGIGVTWGRGQPSNVLIHRDTDDAWIVDFGGGWMQPQVEPEVSGTVEGDELAVKNIFDFLEIQ